MSASITAQDQSFVTLDGQKNLAEIAAGNLAEVRAGNLGTAELGRWFSTQHSFLQGGLVVAGAQTGAAVPTATDPADAATGQMLMTLNGAAFDALYLPSEINGHAQNLAGHQAETASGTNPILVQVATAETPIVQNHLYEAQLLTQEQEGGAAPTVSLTTTFTPAPPLAAEGPLNAADQAFINAASYASMTAVQEGLLAQSHAAQASVQVYGNWDITNDGPLGADLGALAAAGGGTVPTTLDATDASQLAALAGLNGTAFDLQYAVDSIGDYQSTLAALQTEVATGSDPALVALAGAAIPTAEQLLGQAVIQFGQVAAGLDDNAAAPTTHAGAMLNAFGNDGATGRAVFAFASGAAPALPANAPGIFVANQATDFVAAGYGDVIDAAGGAATIVGAAGGYEQVLGYAGMTFFAGAGSSGSVALPDQGGGVFVGPTSGSSSWYVAGDLGSNTISTGAGSTTVAAGPGGNRIALGGGSNLVLSSGADTIAGSTGADTVAASGSGQVVFAGTQGITFVGGSGSASIQASNGSATVFGAAGSNIALFGSASGNTLLAGAGNETLQGGGASGNESIFAGSGNDLLVGGSGTNYVQAGTGNSTIVGGSGANEFQFVAGHAGGSDVIFGFSSADRVSLSGYGATATQQAVAGATTTGGATTIVLTDNTRVTLVGVSGVSGSNFV